MKYIFDTYHNVCTVTYKGKLLDRVDLYCNLYIYIQYVQYYVYYIV